MNQGVLRRIGRQWRSISYSIGKSGGKVMLPLATSCLNWLIRSAWRRMRGMYAGMQQGFFYDFSNYGIHDRLSDDGLTEWHPAFLSLGKSLDECAEKYRKFCKKYKPQPKSEKRCHWGSKLLPKVLKTKERKRRIPGQMRLPWDDWEPTKDEIREVAEKFVLANCYDPLVAMQFFNDS